ncbi:MAG: hypothetical protein R3F38_08535 [Gammaproteobacteria bacterium]
MHKGTILSVEDDEHLQFVLGEYLTDDGYRAVRQQFRSIWAQLLITINVVLRWIWALLPMATAWA